MYLFRQAKSNPEMSKKVAQVYLKLGEVGLESENYAQGIEDFQQCLQIQVRLSRIMHKSCLGCCTFFATRFFHFKVDNNYNNIVLLFYFSPLIHILKIGELPIPHNYTMKLIPHSKRRVKLFPSIVWRNPWPSKLPGN